MTQQRPLGLGTHIFVPDADAAVDFYRAAFGATELIRHNLPTGGSCSSSSPSAQTSCSSARRSVNSTRWHRPVLAAHRSCCCSSSMTSTPPSPTPSPGAPRSNDPWPRCSGASVTGSCVIHSVTVGLCALAASSCSRRSRRTRTQPGSRNRLVGGRSTRVTGLAALLSLQGTLAPTEDPQRPESVPPAGLAVAILELKWTCPDEPVFQVELLG